MVGTLGFTGTREGMTTAQYRQFGCIIATSPPALFRHGDCIGSDAQAHGLVRTTRAIIHVHPPTNPANRAFCNGDVIWLPRPYGARDRDIVNRCDRLVATPKGPEYLRSGTWTTIRYARRIGRPVTIIWPNGEVQE